MSLIQNPSKWRFLAGGDNNLSPQLVAQKVHDAGANGVYACGPFLDGYDWATPTNSGLTQTEWAIQYCQALHALGMLVEFQPVPWAYFASNYNGLGAAAWVETILLNTDGAQDQYVAWMEQIVGGDSIYPGGIQPDIVQIMNEPIGSNSDGTTPYMAQYVAFCNRVMAALAAIKPNLIFVVMGVPFWDLKTINSLNFTVPAGCTLLYSFHYYYWWVGANGWGTNNPGPPSTSNGADPAQIDYWYGNLAQGKIDLVNYLLQNEGIQDAWNHGHTVIAEETGANIENPNYQQYLNDFWSWCVANGIGFVCLSNNDQAGTTIAGGMPGAIFNDDYSLNGIGQVWQKYLSPISQYTLNISTGVV